MRQEHLAFKIWVQKMMTNDRNLEDEEQRRKDFRDSLLRRNLEHVTELLRSGIDIDAPLNECGWTALHFAVENYYVDLVVFLLKQGANPNRADFSGTTPLHLAIDVEADSASQQAPVDYGKRNIPGREMTVLLLAHGADQNAKTEKGETPMDWAMQCRHRGAIDALMSYSAPPRNES